MRVTGVERETLEAVFMEAVDAWNDRDFERFLSCFHPAIEYEILLTRVEGIRDGRWVEAVTERSKEDALAAAGLT